MINDDSIEIAAPPRLVWDVFSDVERWPTGRFGDFLAGLDDRLAVGKRFAIKQLHAKLVGGSPNRPGSSWTWCNAPRRAGDRRHWVIAQPGGGTLVRQHSTSAVYSAHSSGADGQEDQALPRIEAQGLKARLSSSAVQWPAVLT